MPQVAKGKYSGFALVEFENPPSYPKRDAQRRAKQKLRDFERLKAEIAQKRGRGVTSSFGVQNLVRWPQSARMGELFLIKRLYGFPKILEFNLYIEVTANGPAQLTQAFKFLDRHCHVEGYM